MSEKTLTFYSDKLWHSDKPFPVKPNVGLGVSDYLDARYKGNVETWLSTAYEVVNPLDIPGIEPGVETDSPRSYNMKNMVDGYEFALPEGYGIEYILPDRINGFTKTATITLPEKDYSTMITPEMNERLTKPITSFSEPGECPKCRTKEPENCHSMYCPMRKEPVSEPSESQEELAEEIVNVIWNLGDTTSLLHCKNYIKEHYILTRRK